MLMTILSIIANIAYFVVLNLNFYTDRAMMPTGEVLFEIRNRMIRTIQLVSVIGSTIVFIIIMIVTSNSHAKYA